MFTTLLFDPASGTVLGAARYDRAPSPLPANEIGCTADQATGWRGYQVANNAIVAKPPAAADLIAYAVREQQALFDAGLTVDVGTSASPQPIFASTDGQSLAILRKGVADAGANANYTTSWVTLAGTTVLTGPQILKIDAALDAFFQAQIVVCGQIIADVKSGKTTTTAQIDANYTWPSNSVPASS